MTGFLCTCGNQCRLEMEEKRKIMELLPKGVTYYKANLHCHTVLSE